VYPIYVLWISHHTAVQSTDQGPLVCLGSDASYLGYARPRLSCVLPSYCYSLGLLRMASVAQCVVMTPLSPHNTNSRYQELIFEFLQYLYRPLLVWPHIPCPITHTLAIDLTLDQLFEGYNYGHDCHHYAHATEGHDPHDVGRSRHCLQDVKMPKFWGRLLPIYPFHHRQSKIHPRKNHNYYYVCMSTAFIKGRRNPVGFTDCSLQFLPIFNQLPSPKELFSISLSLKEHVFHWSNLTVPLQSTYIQRQNFPPFFQSWNIHADFSST